MELPEYIWPDPKNPGWFIDAWNGIYDSLEEALQEAVDGDWTNNDPGPWILQKGESIITTDEAAQRLRAVSNGI